VRAQGGVVVTQGRLALVHVQKFCLGEIEEEREKIL